MQNKCRIILHTLSGSKWLDLHVVVIKENSLIGTANASLYSNFNMR